MIAVGVRLNDCRAGGDEGGGKGAFQENFEFHPHVPYNTLRRREPLNWFVLVVLTLLSEGRDITTERDTAQTGSRWNTETTLSGNAGLGNNVA